MALRINGLGHGPLADRRLLGERQQRGQSQGETTHRQAPDRVESRIGHAEQMRAEFAALNRAILDAEDALAMAGLAGRGLETVEGRLAGLEARLEAWAGAPAAALAAPPPWLAEALAGIDAVAETTRFGPLRLLDGSLGCSGVAVGDGMEFVGAGAETRSSPPQGYEVLLGEEPIRATLLAERPLTPALIAGGARLLLREGSRTARVQTRPGQSPRDVAEALQAAARQAGLALLTESTEDGRLIVQHELFGAAYGFAAASSVPGVLATRDGRPLRVANGCDIAGTLHGEPARGEGRTLRGCTGNPCTAGLVVRYTGLPFTGRTGQLPRSRPAILEPRVFAGRVVVAQQALSFRLGPEPGDTVTLCLDSVRPQQLGRAVATASGFASLAALRCGTAAETRDALALVRSAHADVQRQRAALRALVDERLQGLLARLRVQSQNFAAASQELLAPGAAIQAVHSLSQRILREARSALTAQTHPPQGSLLELLGGEEQRLRGVRWN